MKAIEHCSSWSETQDILERICWEPHYAWWPIRTMDVYCKDTTPGAVKVKGYAHLYVIPGKWRWLSWVKRHKLDTEKFKDA